MPALLEGSADIEDWLMAQELSVKNVQALSLEWSETGDPDFPYVSFAGNATLWLRINDFPEEPLFSLFVDGRHVADLEDWPPNWRR